MSVRRLSAPMLTELAAQAKVSNRVDFPVPFSPTSRVTGPENVNVRILRITGNENGKPLAADPAGFRYVTAARIGTFRKSRSYPELTLGCLLPDRFPLEGLGAVDDV